MSEDTFDIDDTINETFDVPEATETVVQDNEKEETTDHENTDNVEQDDTANEQETDKDNEIEEIPDPELVKKEKKKKRAQKRIDSLTKRNYELLAKVEKYEQTYGKDFEKNLNPMPDRDDFKSDEEFLESYTDWKADKKLSEKQKSEAVTKRYNEDVEILKAKIEDAKKNQYPDWDEKMSKVKDPDMYSIPDKNKDFFNDVFVHDKHGTDLLYYFASNPDVYRETIDLPPRKAELFVGRLIEKISSKKRQIKAGKVKSKAPTPPSKLAGTSKATKRMDKANMKDYAKWFYERQKKRKN